MAIICFSFTNTVCTCRFNSNISLYFISELLQLGYYRYIISPPPYRGYWNSRLFFTLDYVEFQLVPPIEGAGIKDFLTWPHLEFHSFLLLTTWNSSFCWNSRLFYSWEHRGCWNSRLFCRNCFGIPGFFFVNSPWKSRHICLTCFGIPSFFVDKKIPSIGGSDIIWNSPLMDTSVSRFFDNVINITFFWTFSYFWKQT